MPPDSRREVGGLVWAKAEAVSRDAKRVYGAAVSEKHLMGTVLEVSVAKPDGAKRAVTYITARYKIGDTEKDKKLSLQTLKAQEPAASVGTSVNQDANTSDKRYFFTVESPNNKGRIKQRSP